MVLRLVEDCLMNKTRKLILAVALIIMVLFCWLYYMGAMGTHPQFIKTTFDRLPNWKNDHQDHALHAFKQSCTAILKQDLESPVHQLPQYGKTKDWQIICLAAYQIKQVDNESARKFFELWFEPYRVENNFNAKGLF